jgi:hypothetical protein
MVNALAQKLSKKKLKEKKKEHRRAKEEVIVESPDESIPMNLDTDDAPRRAKDQEPSTRRRSCRPEDRVLTGPYLQLGESHDRYRMYRAWEEAIWRSFVFPLSISAIPTCCLFDICGLLSAHCLLSTNSHLTSWDVHTSNCIPAGTILYTSLSQPPVYQTAPMMYPAYPSILTRLCTVTLLVLPTASLLTVLRV